MAVDSEDLAAQVGSNYIKLFAQLRTFSTTSMEQLFEAWLGNEGGEGALVVRAWGHLVGWRVAGRFGVKSEESKIAKIYDNLMEVCMQFAEWHSKRSGRQMVLAGFVKYVLEELRDYSGCNVYIALRFIIALYCLASDTTIRIVVTEELRKQAGFPFLAQLVGNEYAMFPCCPWVCISKWNKLNG